MNSIEAYQVPIRNWGDFLDAGAEIARGNHEFSTIVIDTIDLAYKMCAEHTCKKAGVDHESDLSYGKGFALVNNEFQRVLTKLAQLPYGMVLISHSQEKEVETRTGKKTRIVPTLPEKARQMVTGLVDIMLYCDLEYCQDETTQKEVCRRVMRARPSDLYDAGDRTGRLPETVPLNYRYFMEAFESQAQGRGNNEGERNAG